MLEPLFNKVSGQKKRLRHEVFAVNFAKFLRTFFLKNTSVWLSLKVEMDSLVAEIRKCNPTNIYLLKSAIETLEKHVKYVES